MEKRSKLINLAMQTLIVNLAVVMSFLLTVLTYSCMPSISVKPDKKIASIPDSAWVKIKFGLDSVQTDETVLVFAKASSALYTPGEDAPYLQGFGLVSLSSLSSDNIKLAINYTPLYSNRLFVGARNSGSYFLKITSFSKIPTDVDILLADKTDTVNLRKGGYKFQISTSDTTTFGANRFKLIIK